mmetsp:Transcript_53129/g.115365  ORF Transcript_53129/g.115365 Transcript_53129/m.115365 type:complete len:170 (-) Transcript_53129:28-537(-)
MNNPDTQTLVYKLWLTEQVPVDYGRDILGANKYLVKKMSIEHGASSVKLVIPGVLELEAPHPTVGTTLAAFPSLIRTAGVVDTIRMLLNKVVAVNIAFSVDVAPRFKSTHPECVSWMHAGPDAAFGEWSPDAKLKMMAPDLQSLGFTPVVAQIDPQLRFALSDPLNGGV